MPCSHSFFLIFFFFWLHRVLVEACGIFRCCAGSSLWHTGFSLVVAAGFLFSSCGAQAPGCMGSVVVARGFQSAWPL